MPSIPHPIPSLRGGLSEYAPALIDDDQCTVADNMEWILTPLGERRLGHTPINIVGSGLATCNWVVLLHRHMPNSDLREAQLWAIGLDYHASPLPENWTLHIAYKDTRWH